MKKNIFFISILSFSFFTFKTSLAQIGPVVIDRSDSMPGSWYMDAFYGSYGTPAMSVASGNYVVDVLTDIFVYSDGEDGLVSDLGGTVDFNGSGNEMHFVSEGKNIYVTNNSIVNFDSLNVYLQKGKDGLYASNGGQISFNSGYFESISNIAGGVGEGYGIFAEGIDTKIAFNQSRMQINDNRLMGIMVRDEAEVKIENSSLSLNDNGFNNYSESYDASGVVVKSGGKFRMFGGDIMSSQNILFTMVDGGQIELHDVIAFSGGRLFEYVDEGLGGAANFTVAGGAIFGSIRSGQTFVDFHHTRWEGIGDSVIDTLHSYDSEFIMNTYFSSNYHGDILRLYGSSDGQDNVIDVIPMGGDGSDGPILLVDQQNAHNPNIEFSLKGGVVDSGYYEYKLYKGDGQGNDMDSYYLRVEQNGQGEYDPKPTDVSKTISNVPAIHLNIVKTGMNELRKRLGDIRRNDYSLDDGAWVRTYGKHLNLNEKISSKMNLMGIEGGYDREVYVEKGNRVFVGGMLGYLYTNDIKINQKNGLNGSGNSKSPSLGFYTTWLNNEGWFADYVFRYFRSEMDIKNITASGKELRYDSDRNYFAQSIEVGKAFEYKQNKDEKYIVEPKTELQYIYSKSGKSRTTNGANIYYGKTSGTSLKFSTLFGYERRVYNGMILKPFIELGVAHEFDGKTDIQYFGFDYQSESAGTTVLVSGGLNAQLDEEWSLYSDIGYEKSSTLKAVSGNLGVRYKF